VNHVRFKSVLLDLDGTLTDSAPGITNCVRHALRTLGRPDVSPDALRWTIGPPIKQWFEVLLETSDEVLVQRGVDLYRERFSSVGWLENALFDGVPEALSALAAAGVRLYVATSKPQVFATRIVEHFGIAKELQGVYGSDLDGTLGNKAELIAHILEKEQLQANDCLMIGDRKHDVIGAKLNAMDCLGVTYGYGSKAELQAAGALALVNHPSEWASFVLS